MKRVASLLIGVALTTGTVRAQPPDPPRSSKLWWTSVATLFASSLLDAHSSWNQPELNPVLRDANGRFGMRAVGIKLGITGVWVATQWIWLRRSRSVERYATLSNFAAASVFTGVAVRNYRLPQRTGAVASTPLDGVLTTPAP